MSSMTDTNSPQTALQAVALVDPTLWHWYRQDVTLREEILALVHVVVKLVAHIRQISFNRQRNQVLLPVQSESGHLEAIFSYLDGPSLASASQTCKTWREVEKGCSELWEKLTINTFDVSLSAVLTVDAGNDIKEDEEDWAKLVFVKLWRSSRMVLNVNAAGSGLGGIKVNKSLLNFMEMIELWCFRVL